MRYRQSKPFSNGVSTEYVERRTWTGTRGRSTTRTSATTQIEMLHRAMRKHCVGAEWDSQERESRTERTEYKTPMGERALIPVEIYSDYIERKWKARVKPL